MANVDVIVRSTDQGSQNIERFGDKLQKLGLSALGITSGLGAVEAGLRAVANAAKVAWGIFEDGAALDLANSRFENLAASIGTTAGALKGDMAEATQGMMSNAQMVASASDIISLGLADSGDEVVRLGNLVGQLGWDMQVLTLTMANDSMLRLDALGLSMTDVKERMEELKAAGMEAGEAFDLAVIEAGEAKLELLGSAADSTAGQIRQLTVIWENARDAFSESFAEGLAERFGQIAGSVTAMGTAIELAAAGAGSVLSNFISNKIFTDPTFVWLVTRGAKEAAATEQAARESATSWETWARSTGAAIAAAEKSQSAIGGSAGALSEWTDEAKEAAIEAANLAGELAGIDLESVAGATQSGIWRTAGAHIQSILDEAAEEGAASHREAAEEIARVYDEAGIRMGQAFSQALQPGNMPDFGNVEAMRDIGWEMAQGYEFTAVQLGNIGIAMGQIDPQMAEMAAKAAIFQEAVGNLFGQLDAGNIDASGFTAAFDALIADLQSKSLVELQVDLQMAANPPPIRIPIEPDWGKTGDPMLPDQLGTSVTVPVNLKPEEAALQAALGMIDGIPDDQTKTITFDAVYDAVTPDATDAISTAITAIDGTVTFTPESSAVDTKILAIDEKRLTVYVDFVPVGEPIPSKASGGRVSRGNAYIVGEYRPELFIPASDGVIVPSTGGGRSGGGGVVINNYITGGDERTVERAMRRTADTIAGAWRRAGGTT